MLRKIITSRLTRTSGTGEMVASLKQTERAMPVVATAQFVVVSSRVRHTLLRYISPRYKWAKVVNSAAEYLTLPVFSPISMLIDSPLPHFYRQRQRIHGGLTRDRTRDN